MPRQGWEGDKEVIQICIFFFGEISILSVADIVISVKDWCLARNACETAVV